MRHTKRAIIQQEMKRALVITVVLACLPGPVLIAMVCHTLVDFVGFLILGGLSIIAAITHTVDSRPYGYIGLGDTSVLAFSDWLSAMGSWYLQAHIPIPVLILPTATCGLLVAAVLNANNLRDISSDRENGKSTLVVRLSTVNACHYHACLLMGSLVCLALFNLFSLHSLWSWLPLLVAPLLVKQTRHVMCEMDLVAMRLMPGRTVKGALLTDLLFVLGIFLSQWAV